jgi:sialate O-acetylesterase
MKKHAIIIIAMLIAFPLLSEGIKSIKLAPIFTDNVVLPRDVPVPVWGSGQPGKSVSLRFMDQEKSALVDAAGRWKILLDPMPANAEDNDLVIGYGESDPDPIAREGVLVGDVWIGAGQSNMEFGVSMLEDRATELKDAKYPLVRLFLVPKIQSPVRSEALPGFWLPCERANLTTGGWSGFSAIGFMFARELFKNTGIPQGIIQTAYGGSAIEPWIAPEELAAFPGLARWNDLLVSVEADYKRALARDPAARHPWEGMNDYDKLKPAVLYRSLIEPIAPFPVKGVVWYQGESNVGDGAAYAEKLRALIASYRRTFANPDLPFFYAQIAPWGSYGGSLPALWAAQESALKIKGTGMAVTVDVGDPGDIHPKNKRPVADRLAFLALKYVYGMKAPESPYVSSFEASGKGLTLALAETDGGLKTSDGKPVRGFRLSADGSAFYPAQAAIEGDRVLLTCPQLDKPTAADYAWQDVPDGNLVGGSGLPARPWKGSLR